MKAVNIPKIRMEHTEDGSVAEIYLYDEIGSNSYFFDLFSAKDMRNAIAEAGSASKITLRINSMGGSPYQAVAMYNLLKDSGKEVVSVVDGIAASSATIPAMAGRLEMRKGSELMIHDPEVETRGNVRDLKKSISQLEAMMNSVVSIYAEKSGKSDQSIRIMMENETWLTDEQAKNEGFADSIDASDTSRVEATRAMAMKAKQINKSTPDDSLVEASNNSSQELEMTQENQIETPAAEVETPQVESITMSVSEYEALKAKAVPVEATRVVPTEGDAIGMSAENAAVLAERKRVSNIASICMKVGFDAKTESKFIEDGASIEAVQCAALDKMTATNQPPTGDSGNETSDEDAQYRQEYRDAKTSGVKMSSSEDEYVDSRRITVGKEPLMSTL